MDLITTIWVGESLPKIAQLCIKSHLGHGFAMQLYVYHHIFKDYDSVPSGCEIKDAEDVLPAFMIYKQKAFNSYAPFVDMWRFAYEIKYGGPVMDLDFICLRHWDINQAIGYRDGSSVIVGLMNFPAKHPLMKDMLLTRLFPDVLVEQAPWVVDKFSSAFGEKKNTKSWHSRISDKGYMYASSEFLTAGCNVYGLFDKTKALECFKWFPSSYWLRLFDGAVRIEDPSLARCDELHLHGHRIYSYNKLKLVDNAAKNSVFTKLWERHFVDKAVEVQPVKTITPKKKEVIGLWIGKELPLSAQLSIKSHLDHGFDYKLFVYDHLFTGKDTVPSGCRLEDANAIIDKAEIFKNKSWGSWAPFSDYWRCAYLAKYGGLWLDLDIVALNDWAPEHYFYSDDPSDKMALYFSMFNVPAGLPLMEDLLNSWKYPNILSKQAPWIQKNFAEEYDDDATLSIGEQRSNKHYGWSGSRWLRPGVEHYNLKDKVGFMPHNGLWPSSKWKQFFNGDITLDTPELNKCDIIELHGAMFAAGTGSCGADKGAHPDSLFAQLWKCHMGKDIDNCV